MTNMDITKITKNITRINTEKSDFVVKKIITLPLLKFVIDQTVYVQILNEFFIGKEMKKADAKSMGPVTLANCVNLKTGEICQIIISVVLKGILEDEYPAEDYVQRAFSIKKGAKASGKNYNPYTVSELELPKLITNTEGV